MVQSFTRTRPLVISRKLLVGLVEEIFRDIFGRWIQPDKRLKVVEHLVVDAVDHRAQHLLEQLESRAAGRTRPARAPASVTRTL